MLGKLLSDSRESDWIRPVRCRNWLHHVYWPYRDRYESDKKK